MTKSRQSNDRAKKANESRQYDRFIDAARAIGCDEDKEKFEAQLGKIASHKATRDSPLKSKRPKKKSRQS